VKVPGVIVSVKSNAVSSSGVAALTMVIVPVLNSASTDTSLLMAKVHGLVVQPPPEKVRNEPVAVSVTGVPSA